MLVCPLSEQQATLAKLSNSGRLGSFKNQDYKNQQEAIASRKKPYITAKAVLGHTP